jgi:hypothetical protein
VEEETTPEPEKEAAPEEEKPEPEGESEAPAEEAILEDLKELDSLDEGGAE